MQGMLPIELALVTEGAEVIGCSELCNAVDTGRERWMGKVVCNVAAKDAPCVTGPGPVGPAAQAPRGTGVPFGRGSPGCNGRTLALEALFRMVPSQGSPTSAGASSLPPGNDFDKVDCCVEVPR